MNATLYPPADAHSQWFADDFRGITADTVDRLVVHTTEGSTPPDYQGGAIAPNWTGRPVIVRTSWRLAWRQHFPANMSSRALKNLPGGVQTNVTRAAQVELIGTCVKGGPGLYWGAAPDSLLDDLGVFVAWLHTEWGLTLDAAALWVPPSAAGDGQRMSFAEWIAFRGICGHEHVPENDHRDPGALNITRVLASAAAALAPTPLEDPPMPTADEVTDRMLGGGPPSPFNAKYRVHDPDHPDAVHLLTLTDAASQSLARTKAVQDEQVRQAAQLHDVQDTLARILALVEPAAPKP